MEKEYNAIIDNNTWELCDTPPGANIIGSRWVYKCKTHDNELIFKAHLVARGYNQIKGIDYDDTFAPVVRLASVRLFFLIAAVQDFEIFHFNVNSAFLQGNLEEVIYLQQPVGFVKPGYEKGVYKL